MTKVTGMLNKVELELSEEHAHWLEDARKIPCELAVEMGIRSRGKNLVFEYRSKGHLLWRQVRIEERREDGTMGKTFRCYAPDGRTLKDAGIPLSFWNEDELTRDGDWDVPRIITEGQFDAASFKLAGMTIVGSVPNGAVDRIGDEEVIDPETDTRFQYLWELKGNRWQAKGGLAAAKMIILATDNDKAGRTLREELAIRLGRTRCWYVEYPDGCKDANDVLQKFGEAKGCEILADVIAEARPIVPSRLVKFSDIPISKREAVHSGWPILHHHLKIVRPELMIITGPPNHGKSQFATALGCNLAHFHNWRGAIIQFEDDVERNRDDLTRFWLGKNIGGDWQKWSDEDKRSASAWIDRMFRTISPSEDLDDVTRDMQWLDANIEEAVTRHGARWVVIDPWNELEHVFSKGQTEAQYLNDAIRRLKRLARRFQILLIIVSHPDKQGGQIPEIDEWSLYNMSGGAVWNNKADHGIIVLRPDKDRPETYIKVSKSKRHAVMGRPGVVQMKFNPVVATYEAAT